MSSSNYWCGQRNKKRGMKEWELSLGAYSIKGRAPESHGTWRRVSDGQPRHALRGFTISPRAKLNLNAGAPGGHDAL